MNWIPKLDDDDFSSIPLNETGYNPFGSGSTLSQANTLNTSADASDIESVCSLDHIGRVHLPNGVPDDDSTEPEQIPHILSNFGVALHNRDSISNSNKTDQSNDKSVEYIEEKKMPILMNSKYFKFKNAKSDNKVDNEILVSDEGHSLEQQFSTLFDDEDVAGIQDTEQIQITDTHLDSLREKQKKLNAEFYRELSSNKRSNRKETQDLGPKFSYQLRMRLD